MLVIKKSINLDSLGDEYKGITLNFNSVPAKDLQDIVRKESEAKEDDNKFIPYIIELLQRYFLDGKQEETVLDKEDVALLDGQALIHVYSILVGSGLDPKDNGSLTKQSTTEQKNQTS